MEKESRRFPNPRPLQERADRPRWCVGRRKRRKVSAEERRPREPLRPLAPERLSDALDCPRPAIAGAHQTARNLAGLLHSSLQCTCARPAAAAVLLRREEMPRAAASAHAGHLLVLRLRSAHPCSSAPILFLPPPPAASQG